MPAVLLKEPADIERVLVTEHRDFGKPPWLRTAAVRRLLGAGLVASDGELWRRQRHVCQPAFHLRRLDRYGEAISALAESTLAGWRDGESRDLQREMSHLTLEVIARTLLNVTKPDWTDEASDAMDTLMARFAAKSGLYGMAPRPPSFAELMAERKLNRVVDSLISASGPVRASGQVTASRAASASGHLSVSGQASNRGTVSGIPTVATGTDPRGEAVSLLEMLQKPVSEGGEGLSGSALRDQVKTFLGAGYESSALTLTWAFLLLAEEPRAQGALLRELDHVLGDGSPAPADVPRLAYTEAVVKETLRLYPPLWMTGRQSLRRCEIGGRRIGPGTLVMTSQWAVHRNPAFYPEADQFRPERWLNGETADLPRFAYFPFGGGPRVCIGQSFAILESVLLLASIARRFHLEPVSGVPARPWATMTLRPRERVVVRLSDRRA